MPKVSQEYLDTKKKSIADAARRVCLRKPVGMVTMMDVIEETGLSQGGIYRFYKDLDEILSAMVTGMRSDYSIINEIETLFQNAEESDPAKVIHKVCDVLADVMEKHLMDIQKINFDLTVLAINEPERAAKIMGGIGGRSSMEFLSKVALPKLFEKAGELGWKFREDPEKIMNYISSAYVGIEMNCILTACYRKAPMGAACSPKPLFDTMAKTLIYLCGGEEDKV